VRAQKDDRRTLGPGNARQQVPRVRARLGPRAVLGDVQAQRAQVGAERIGERALVARGALDLAEPDEVVDEAQD